MRKGGGNEIPQTLHFSFPFHPIAHDQHSKQAVGTLTWMANMYIYSQLSQMMVLVTFIWLRQLSQEDTCIYVSPRSFPPPIHTHTCTLRCMITLEEASSPAQCQRPPFSH